MPLHACTAEYSYKLIYDYGALVQMATAKDQNS